jgi:AbiJ N-terminal domain 3/Abortive infection C-terminus
VSISEITRRAIIDEMSLSKVHWAGRLEEPEFLARLYKLKALPSTDGRFKDAAGDIWQHRVNNYDWDDDWVFYDSRFDLMEDDEEFLRFLAETVHPVVRPNESDLEQLVTLYNTHLRHDGWEIREVSQISGRPVFAAHNRLTVPPALGQVEKSIRAGDMAYLSQQITRMESAVEADPALAIGTAKELVETCCATILLELEVVPDKEWTLSKLVKETASRLRLTPADVADDARGAASIRQVLGNLGGMVAGIAELRNHYGTGHGKAIGHGGLGPRHARLAVGAASTLAAFLFETFEQRTQRPTTP